MNTADTQTVIDYVEMVESGFFAVKYSAKFFGAQNIKIYCVYFAI
jgi:hypothetical protein